MLIIVKWLGAMQFVKDVLLVRFIPVNLGENIIPIFISSLKTKFIVLALYVLLRLVIRVSVERTFMDSVHLLTTRFLT